MAFGITRQELNKWKSAVLRGEIAFLTHYWNDPRFPGIRTITKVGCSDIERLMRWCRKYNLNVDFIHFREKYPHFDLMGHTQKMILYREHQWEQIRRFGL